MNMQRFAVRSLIVILIVALFFAFLQMPRLIERFKTQKSITVLAWPNVIDTEYFKPFEEKTGIKVYLSYFENYEELLVKMRSGSSDYDLIMASDYAVNIIISEGAIKPIDQSQLPFLKDIYPTLRSLYYDPENRYTIPFSWELYGIGIDKSAFPKGEPPASWRLLFDPAIAPDRVGMLDDAREIVSIAALYLFGPDKKVLDHEDMQKIKELLRAQKKRVVMYTDLRTDYLLVSQSAPAVLGLSSDIYHAMKKHDNIQFLVPKEGAFVIIDNFMMPTSTQKDALVYSFLNYLYQPHIIKKYVQRYTFFPTIQGVLSEKDRFFLAPTAALFSRLHFFSYDIPEQALRELWIALKS